MLLGRSSARSSSDSAFGRIRVQGHVNFSSLVGLDPKLEEKRTFNKLVEVNTHLAKVHALFQVEIQENVGDPGDATDLGKHSLVPILLKTALSVLIDSHEEELL